MTISSLGQAGLYRAEQRIEGIAQRMASPESSSADPAALADAVVGLIDAQHMAELNIKMLKAADEMNRQVLDILL